MIPKINFLKLGLNQLPLNKRIPFWKGWIVGILSQMDRSYGIFYKYMNGSTASYWDSSITYSIDQEVQYNYQIYKSLLDGNLNTIPDINSDRWEFIQPSFIGASERSSYCYPRLTLEWALNRYFKRFLTNNGYIGFVQPDSPISPTRSSIYITNVVALKATFLVANTEVGCDYISNDGSTGFVTNTEIFNTVNTCQFNVNMPSAVFTAIYPSSAVIAESIIRKFLDQYVIAGVFYNIVTY